MAEPRVSCELVAPSAGLVRVARAGVLGGLSLLLATGAHVLGGGSLPGVGVLLVAATLLGLLAAVVTARRCRFTFLVALLAAQQLALHELFSLAAAARSCVAAAPGMAHTGGAGHALSSCGPAGAMTMTTDVPGWVMVVAHVVAVVATAWLLARGEAWLWRAVDRIAAASGLVRSGRTLPARRAVRTIGRANVFARSLPWATAAPRGPPVAHVG